MMEKLQQLESVFDWKFHNCTEIVGGWGRSVVSQNRSVYVFSVHVPLAVSSVSLGRLHLLLIWQGPQARQTDVSPTSDRGLETSGSTRSPQGGGGGEGEGEEVMSG